MARAAQLALPALLVAGPAFARPPPEAASTAPHLRICCALGHDISLRFGARTAPVGLQNVVEAADLGHHRYRPRTGFSEKNGLVYGCRAGFVDVAHLRSAADLTAHVYARLAETGPTIHLDLPDGAVEVSLARALQDDERLAVAQRVAYDLTVWHEIVTGVGDSTVSIFSEAFSALSPEDLYSDLVGVRLGAAAIASPLTFDEAMQGLLSAFLDEAGARRLEGTRDALDQVEGRWWRKGVFVPDAALLATRNRSFRPPLRPWFVPRPESLGCHAPRPLVVDFAPGPEVASLYRVALFAHEGSTLGRRPYSEPDFEALVDRAAARLSPPEAPAPSRGGIRVLPLRGFGGARDFEPVGGLEVVGATSDGLGGDLSVIRFAAAHLPGQGLVAHFTGLQADHLFFCAERGGDRVHPPIAAWFQTCQPRGFFGVGGTLAQVQHDGATGRWALRPVEAHVSFSLLDDAFAPAFLRRHLVLSTGVSVETAKRPETAANLSVRANAQLRGRLATEDQRWQADLHLLFRQDVTDIEDLAAEAGVSVVRRIALRDGQELPRWGTTTLGIELAAARWSRPEAALDDHLLPLTPTNSQDSLRATFTLGFSFERWVF